MTTQLAAKLDFVLKALSMSRGRLAAELGVDKSAAGRWVTGAATPSAHNMSQLTGLVAQRIPGFTSLDWERDLEGLAEALGVSPPGKSPPAETAHPSLTIPLLAEAQAMARLRGEAYEGFYRSTRPFGQHPGVFLHDYTILRLEADGSLHMAMNALGVRVEGKVLLLHNQLFIVATEMTSGAFVFAIVNGVSSVQAGVLDGLIMYCAQDPGRTPTATAAVWERVGDLSGDRAADDARFETLGKLSGMATEESAPPAIRAHLVRNLGPDQLPDGDWLLRSPLARALSRGLTPRIRF
jgi:transcriptional regulator with XRE-family HTH domain